MSQSYQCSCGVVEPVTWGLVSSESFFSELFVTSILHGVDLKSVRVAVDIVILSEEIRDWIDSHRDSQSGIDHHLLVWHLGS